MARRFSIQLEHKHHPGSYREVANCHPKDLKTMLAEVLEWDYDPFLHISCRVVEEIVEVTGIFTPEEALNFTEE
jgi:hypothetical protein